MNDFDNEITPGIAKFVAWLNSRGYATADSGDGTTNTELHLSCAMDTPNVFFDSTDKSPEFMINMIDELHDALVAQGVDFSCAEIGFSYCPSAENKVMAYLFGVADEMLFGEDPDLPLKRLDYQIRYCNNWIANPPIEKMKADGDTEEDITHALLGYAELRKNFEDKKQRLCFDELVAEGQKLGRY